MFGGEGSEAARKQHLEATQQFGDNRPTLTTVLEPYPDSMGAMISRHFKEEREKINQQWQDHVIEPERKPITLLAYQAGQSWWVKLPGAVGLTKVKIAEVTPKTVEFRSQYGTSSRYAIADVEFVEMASP